ncbi:MAG: DUF3846 domain-containing protein [Cyanobacteriota bacterium]|nr:DUF3846 domain-containing protein [Cyanobacteriota bacterium]
MTNLIHTYGLLLPSKSITFPKVDRISVELLQQKVGGYFQAVYNPFMGRIDDSTLVAVVNDEGAINGMKPNLVSRYGTLYGPVIFCRFDPETEDLVGLYEGQMMYLKELKKMFNNTTS